MTKQVQIRRGTGSQHTSFTGAEGEISVNTTNDSVHVHDGTTTGGKELARADGSNVAFTSGTIDGAVIGGTTAAAGSFTTIDATGNITVGGTVDGRDIASDGTKLDGIEASATADQTGAEIATAISGETVGSITLTTADINGGTIDGAVIGGTTPAAGTFTTGQFNTSLNVDGTVTADGLTIDGGITNFGIVVTSSDQFAGIAFADNTTTNNATVAVYADGNNLGFEAGNAERMRLDSSGRLGLGTSSPTGAFFVAKQTDTSFSTTVGTSIGGSSSTGAVEIFGSTTGASLIDFSPNDGVTDFGGRIFYSHGSDYMSISTNGSERMRLDSSGRLGLGTSSISSDADRLHVDSSGTNSVLIEGTGTKQLFSYHDSGGTGWATGAGAGYTNLIYLSDTDNSIRQFTNGSERMRIDASGNVLVGKTTADNTTAGTTIYGGPVRGAASFVRDGGSTVIMNRLNNDGEIAVFRKNSTTVGSIGVNGSSLTVGRGSSGVHFYDGGTKIIVPANPSTGGDNDATVDLGYSSSRFRNLYLSSGVYLGGTGSANHLDDYEEGTFTPVMTGVSGWSGSSGVSGKYTKIGNTVHIFIVMTSNVALTGTASNTISGLPFSNTNAERSSNVSVSRMFGINLTTTDYIAGVANTEIFFSYVNGDNNGNNFTHSGSTLRFTVSATYQTA